MRAELPQARLRRLIPAGGAPGARVEVRVAGDDLDEASALFFSDPRIRARPVREAKGPIEELLEIDAPLAGGRFEVEIDASVPPGIYEAWVRSRFGIGGSRAFHVAAARDVDEAEDNDALERAQAIELEPGAIVVNGAIDRQSDRDTFRFRAASGERVLVECVAARLDSRLEPRLTLFDGEGRELQSESGRGEDDVLLDFTAPIDGEYRIELRDALFRGSGELFYRLRFHHGPHIDFAVPAAVPAGTLTPVRIFGRGLKGGALSDVEVDGCRLEVIEVLVRAPVGDQAIPVPSRGAALESFRAQLAIGDAVPVPFDFGIAREPIEIEAETGEAGDQRIEVPCDLTATLAERGDTDSFVFRAEKGEVFRIEAIAQRWGSPLDLEILIEQISEDGSAKEIARVDDAFPALAGGHFDTANGDPQARLAAGESSDYRVRVRDLLGPQIEDPRLVYRLVVRHERPDFRLLALSQYPETERDANRRSPDLSSLALRRHGFTRLRVLVLRQDGFDAPVRVHVEGLPAGVEAEELVIGKGEVEGKLDLRSSDTFEPGAGELRLVGVAELGFERLERRAIAGELLWPASEISPARARAAARLDLAAIDDAAPLDVSLREDIPVWRLARGAKLSLPARWSLRELRDGEKLEGNVQLAVEDLPGDTQAKAIELGGDKAEGDLELEVKRNAPLGLRSARLVARAEITRSRDPARVERDRALVARVEAVLAESKNALEEIAVSVPTEETSPPSADGASGAANAEPAAETSAEPDAQKDARRAALAARVALAERAREAAKARLAETEKALKPEKQRTLAACEVPLEILASPIVHAADVELALAAGASAEVEVPFERISGFDGEVEIAIRAPADAQGVEVKSDPVAKDASRIVLRASAPAELGSIELVYEIDAKTKLNGVDATSVLKLKVRVAPASP